METDTDAKRVNLHDVVTKEQQEVANTSSSEKEKQELEWAHSGNNQDALASQRRVMITPSTETVQRKLNNVDFREDRLVQGLLSMLNKGRTPYIPLGTHNDIAYRLLPNTRVLCSDVPTGDTPIKLSDGSRALPPDFLAVNPRVRPMVRGKPYTRPRGRDNVPPKLTASNGSCESNPTPEDVFVFFQLGSFEYSRVSPDKFTDDLRYSRDGCWFRTKIAVIVKLSSTGVVDGIYIMFNFNPFHEVVKRRYNYDVNYKSWGYLPGKVDTQIFYAKIADRFEDLADGKEFDVTCIHQHPAELSRAVKTKDGRFLMDPKAVLESRRLHKQVRAFKKQAKGKFTNARARPKRANQMRDPVSCLRMTKSRYMNNTKSKRLDTPP